MLIVLTMLTELTLEDIKSIEWSMKVNIPFFDLMCTQLFFLLPPPPLSFSGTNRNNADIKSFFNRRILIYHELLRE